MYRITLTIINRNTSYVEFRTGLFSSRGCDAFIAAFRADKSRGYYKQFICNVITFNPETNKHGSENRTLTYQSKDVMVESFCKECIGISNLAEYK